jgi:hypothetical protein
MYNIQQDNMPQGNNVKINNFLLIPTKKSYRDVYQRSFELNAQVSTLSKLEAVFNNSGVGRNAKVIDNQIANAIPEISRLQANPMGRADIPNGWGTQRIRFILEVESIVNGLIMVSYIQGFSEYHDPSFSGYIDPRMQFYVNSVTNVVKMLDPTSGTYRVMPKNTFNVITDLAGGQKYQEIDNNFDLKLLRPKDIMENLESIDFASDQNDMVIDTTGGINSGSGDASNRANNDPIKHFTKTLNAFIDAKNNSEVTTDHKDILRTASSLVEETNILSIPFFYALHTVSGDFSPSKFTLEVMQSIDPGLSSKTHMIDNATDIALVNNNTMLDTMDTADMLQPTAETMKATVIAQSINSIMLDQLLSSISVSITNQTGGYIVALTDVKSFIEGIDVTAYANRAVSQIEAVLMPLVTDGNLTMIEAFITADILGDTTIGISVNMQPNVVYRFPTFADSLYSPVVSSADNKARTINDFSNILDMTYNPAEQQPTQYHNMPGIY